MRLRVMLDELLSYVTVGSTAREVGQDGGPSEMDEVGAAEEFDLRVLRQRLRDYLMSHYLGLHITIVALLPDPWVPGGGLRGVRAG
jgi:hypothetical protein